MNRQQKIILMIIPNLNFGGAQRVFYNHSIELSRNHKVVECVFNFDAGHAFQSGNEVFSLNVAGGANALSKLIQFFKRIQALRALKKKLKPDISISHLEGADLINILSAQGEKTITWVHGSKWYDQNISGILGIIRHRLLIPFMYSRASCVVTVSEAIKQELIFHYRVKPKAIQTIYNYFDGETISDKGNIAIPANFQPIYEGAPVLIFSGRLVTQKNPAAMLHWFASFVLTHHCKLVIVGEGDLRDELLDLCADLKLNTYHPWSAMELHAAYQVYFLGFQSNPFQFIKRATVFVLPSMWEGFPMVLGEAMYCGIPIVSADCPTGPREMLMDTEKSPLSIEIDYPYKAEFGVLLPILNESTQGVWTKAFSELINDKVVLEYYKKKSTGRAVAFSKEQNASQVSKLVDRILL
ncbi:glycosyltransferase [Chryseotalea sanaruensis]|uniref:Glycosyltransferase n=1 Tax=Chryseotalea sanaruensis TaxID=2482724 RepID=A0A401UAY7_9BACT|nr:glycosyltransferase [Chryseotalea sanaruensis]GCC52049.1 glycosyltransferase [Chryseotalea sanaruensis]